MVILQGIAYFEYTYIQQINWNDCSQLSTNHRNQTQTNNNLTYSLEVEFFLL